CCRPTGGPERALRSAADRSSGRWGRGLDQELDLALEVLRALEALVHRREPDRGDAVEAPQVLEHQRADLGALDLSTAHREAVLDRRQQRVQDRGFDPPPLARRLQTGAHLGPFVGFTPSVALDHDQRHLADALERREPRRAQLALTATSDGAAVVRGAGVHDPVLESTPAGATHGAGPTGAYPWATISHHVGQRSTSVSPERCRKAEGLTRTDHLLAVERQELVHSLATVHLGGIAACDGPRRLPG